MSVFISVWRTSLHHFLDWFQALRCRTVYFPFKAFLIFCGINFVFFWWALLTAYPGLLRGPKAVEYVLMAFPIAVLGGTFDCMSMLITLLIVRRALKSHNDNVFLAYLSVDIGIAMLGALWVLFTFILSGWLVSLMLSVPETVADRSDLYQWRVQSLIYHPLRSDSLRNLYFGAMMGASVLFPTLLHLFFVGRSMLRSFRKHPQRP